MGRRTVAQRIRNHALALWKRILSYRKRDWDLKDYPIEFRTQGPEPSPRPSRLKLNPFVAAIVNWWLSGTGETREEALVDLRHHFENAKAFRKESGEPLPRPGTNAPISYAPHGRVDAHRELSADFIRRILGVECAWISDESSLWDFHFEETNDALLAKIQEVYGVDVSDIESARLCEIFERISRGPSK
jgi:hypothetical protein